jgi:hypothetical protein
VEKGVAVSISEGFKTLASSIRKYKDPELLDQVVTLQNEVWTLQDRVRSLEKENEELRNQLKLKSKMIFRKPFYFMEGDEVPFCPRCYEGDEKCVHLLGPTKVTAGMRYKCPSCNFSILSEKFIE